ncbi:hypothetical protein CF327_g7044 [Tilletia walkeri]|nr:hypothetical protein CF327_g7044 [Tilletia walkeri]
MQRAASVSPNLSPTSGRPPTSTRAIPLSRSHQSSQAASSSSAHALPLSQASSAAVPFSSAALKGTEVRRKAMKAVLATLDPGKQNIACDPCKKDSRMCFMAVTGAD